LERIDPEDRERLLAAGQQLARQGQPRQLECRYTRRDGTVRTLYAQGSPVVDEHGVPAGIEGTTQDITARVEARERIRRLADYDATTGLANRKLFTELALPALEQSAREGSSVALFYLYIDLFMAVNDAFGRDIGDAVLKEVADRLRTWNLDGSVAAGE